MRATHASPNVPENVTQGSDNLFADLGLPDSEERLLKATLVTRVRAVIADRGLTQSKAGDIMGLPQPKVSELVSGAAAGFSAERLIHLLNKLGVSVQIAFAEEPDFVPGETTFAWDREPDAGLAEDAGETEESEPEPAFAM